MRHRVGGFKLGRTTAHRRAMWRNMAISLFTHGQITTTVTKAKSLRPFVERLVTLAKRGDLASRRRVIQAIGDPFMVDRDIKAEDRPSLKADGYKVDRYNDLLAGPKVVKHLFDEIGPRYSSRDGGYTRIVRLGKHRIGDGGDLCVIQLVADGEEHDHSNRSNRRKIADRRTAFAAQVRKGGDAAAAAPAAEAEPEAADEQPEAEAEEAAEADEKE